VVLPDTGEAAALQIAETLRAAVHALALPQAGREGGVVTISAGIAVAEGYMTAGSLLQAADHTLYLAKKGGRDQVVRAQPAPAIG